MISKKDERGVGVFFGDGHIFDIPCEEKSNTEQDALGIEIRFPKISPPHPILPCKLHERELNVHNGRWRLVTKI